MSETHAPRRALLSNGCWITLPAASSVQETGFLRYVAEQRDMLSRAQRMESESHCAPPSLGEMIRWLILPNVVILTLERESSKTGCWHRIQALSSQSS